MRPLYVSLAIFLIPGVVRAQPEHPPAVPVTKLTVKAAPVPVPVLRYELLPGYREQVPHNAVLAYHRAFLLLSQSRFPDPKAANDRDFKIDEMLAKPAKDVNLDELRGYIQPYRNVLREVENGAKCDRCDWDLEWRIDADGVGTLLPEVQKMRELGRLLSVRCRLHILEGKVAEALQDVQLGLALGRHAGEGPTLIQSLVGVALSSIALGNLEKMIEMPNCPNFYWPLTALPRPFHETRKAIEGEMRMLEGTLPLLKDLEKGPMTSEQARRAIDQWVDSFAKMGGLGGGKPSYIESPLVLAAGVAMLHPKARQSLLNLGKTEAELNAMPAAQIVLLDAVIRFKSLRDEMFILFNLPYIEARRGFANVNERALRMRADGLSDPYEAMLSLLLPAVDKVHFASQRPDRKIAVLRTIEALRLHAAANGNRFPAKLSDITLVPIPIDPLTGTPFQYECTDDGRALLTAPTPQGQAPNIANTLKYELSLAQ
jgi:hypothetical protein